MRSDNLIISANSSITQYLFLGDSTWLFFKGHIAAVRTDEYIYFADVTHSRAAQKLINDFGKNLPHVRVPPADFDYYVASSGMRALRPLLGRPSEPTTPEEGAKR